MVNISSSSVDDDTTPVGPAVTIIDTIIEVRMTGMALISCKALH